MVNIFSPVYGQPVLPGFRLFKDKRIDDRFELLMSSMENKNSCVINKVSSDHAERQGNYRMMRNEHFTVQGIVGRQQGQCSVNCLDRNVLVASDTTTITLKKALPHLKDAEKVGTLSDGKTPGMFCHFSLAMDAYSGAVYGCSDAQYWSRGESDKREDGYVRSPQEIESYKWQNAIINSEQVLAQAKTRTYLFDSEADQYNIFELIDQLGPWSHLLCRVYQNRKLAGLDNEPGADMDDLIARTPVSHTYKLSITQKDRKNSSRRKREIRKARTAKMKLRYTPMFIAPPGNRKDAQVLKMYTVDVTESPDTVPAGEQAIHWRLMTTHVVESVEQALQIVKWYRMRWTIEQLFRVIKKKGLDIEQSQLRYYSSLVKLTAMVFAVAVKVIQLRCASDHPEQRLTQMFIASECECLKVLNKKYQGKTELQRNPYPEESLAWGSWVIARLGGWKGYQSQGLAGPITLFEGVEKFNVYHQAWLDFTAH